MRLLVALVTAGCGAASPPHEHPRAIAPHASYAIELGELGDPGIVEKIPHRARLATIDQMWLGLDAEGQTSSGETSRPVVPVVGESGGRVRVVSTDDDARIALWVDRRTLAPAIVAPIELADAHGSAARNRGAWLAVGADIDVGAEIDGLREVTLRDDSIRVTGFAPIAAIGTVWVGVEPANPKDNPRTIAKGAIVRDAPSADARVIAEARDSLGAHVVAPPHDGWLEIELERPALRVRGFVREELFGEALGIRVGSGHGHGYGISDTDRLDVAAGACLYDRVDGEVIGVNLKTRERFAERGSGAWATVWVGTEYWGLAQIVVHVIEDHGQQVTLESCAR